MLERWITTLSCDDAGLEETAATRERLKDRFPKNATRRMTQLGLLIGGCLEKTAPTENDTLVYASGYAETRALEGYLDSFPSASPTLFQTSIHPSAVQQALITRQQPVRFFFPLTGSDFLPAQALQVAMLAPTSRVVLCGGEERGSWLLENNSASDRTFAFALALSATPENALAKIALEFGNDESASPPSSALSLPKFFDLLRDRQAFSGLIAPERKLTLSWV